MKAQKVVTAFDRLFKAITKLHPQIAIEIPEQEELYTSMHFCKKAIEKLGESEQQEEERHINEAYDFVNNKLGDKNYTHSKYPMYRKELAEWLIEFANSQPATTEPDGRIDKGIQADNGMSGGIAESDKEFKERCERLNKIKVSSTSMYGKVIKAAGEIDESTSRKLTPHELYFIAAQIYEKFILPELNKMKAPK